MEQLQQYSPTKVYFGAGSLGKVGEIAAAHADCALLVTMPWKGPQAEQFQRAKELMEKAGVRVVVFDKVVENPTASGVDEAVGLAVSEGAGVVVGMGGGSSIDTAKAVAVGATHPGRAWDYVYTEKRVCEKAKTLPIVAVTTTSGTGSHMTKYAVFTNPDIKVKSTIVNEAVFPAEAVVDPVLMTTMPAFVTATTGFDAFSHAFESFTNVNANPFIDMLAFEAMRIVSKNLMRAVECPEDVSVRTAMAYADTLAGISIANVGTTLPHSIGQPISGKCPWVPHGQSLALVYPEFLKFTQDSCVAKSARVARLFDPALEQAGDGEAAGQLSAQIVKLQREAGIYTSLSKLKVPKEEIEGLVRDAMLCPDTYVNPRVPTENEVRRMLLNMWQAE